MAYSTLEEVKSTLGLDNTDTSKDGLIQRLLMVSTTMINRYCHRNFGDPPATAAAMRVYNAPDGPDLYVDDYTDVTSVVIVLSTSTITLTSSEYQKLPRNLVDGVQPSYYILRRVSNGRPWSWWGDDEGLNGVTVQVTAKWQFDAAQVPWDVQQACLIMACRLYHRDTAQYANLSGVDANGMQAARMPLSSMDPDVCKMLDSYRKLRIA